MGKKRADSRRVASRRGGPSALPLADASGESRTFRALRAPRCANACPEIENGSVVRRFKYRNRTNRGYGVTPGPERTRRERGHPLRE
ncbi:hypothetical protein HSRCO_2725 [Halanaeroarchaeum sp. HSR-CO]|nr:hypothetical protein HSRCO_2725 [Halanaeroarchaeum sp. HSR-CO]